MIDNTINTSQVHHRGVPGPRSDDQTPGSVIEHLSTSMKVVLLQCNLIEDPGLGRTYELFEVNPHLIEKVQKRFYQVGRRDLKDSCRIHFPEDVRLLVPKSATEMNEIEQNVQLTVWPKVFVCSDCNLILYPTSQEISDMIQTRVFKKCECGRGEFKQSPHILQCKICGSIRNIPSKCKTCNEVLHLHKGSVADIETWRLECKNHHVHDFNEYPDVYLCDGEDQLIPRSKHQEIAEGRKAARSVMTTVGRGICSPLIYRFPVGEDNLELANDEMLIVAGNCHRMDFEKAKPPAPATLREFEGLNRSVVRGFDFSGNNRKEDLIRRSEDWITLLSSSSKLHGPVEFDALVAANPSLKEDIERIRKTLRIIQIRYIEDVAIINGTYGMVRGSIHPIFRGKQIDPVKVALPSVAYGKENDRFKVCENTNNSFPVIVTKRKTEGLAFVLQAKGIVEIISHRFPDAWKLLNAGEQNASDFTEEEARAWLMYACFDATYGEPIISTARTIVHSICHAIIHRFARASGLRDQDLGELLYPEFAGFALYNGLERPLGMLRRVFEDALGELLSDEIIDEMRDCDMDPTCGGQAEGAACHACLHVPEHVCELFNSDLDRRILVGKEGYWQ